MNKKRAYITLVFETLSAIAIGIIGCVDGQTRILEVISVFLLIISFSGILYLFSKNERNSKKNIADLIFSVIIGLINHSMLGLVFGWNECPMI